MSQIYHPFQPLLTQSGQYSFGIRVQQKTAEGHLRGIIRSYLQITCENPTNYPMIPDGTQAVFIGQNSIQIGGAQLNTQEIRLPEAGLYFGIHFYPGAIRHLFKLNLSEITGQFVDAQYFPSVYFSRLHQMIYDQNNFEQRVSVCDKWIFRHFIQQPVTAFDVALVLVYQSSGNIDVVKIARQVGVSPRHLNRQFQQYTGLSTKVFAQIIRIQHACKQLYQSPKSSLITAEQLGFFDQAHLLNEYKRHILTNPRSLYKRFMSDFYNKPTL